MQAPPPTQTRQITEQDAQASLDCLSDHHLSAERDVLFAISHLATADQPARPQDIAFFAGVDSRAVCGIAWRIIEKLDDANAPIQLCYRKKALRHLVLWLAPREPSPLQLPA